MSTMISVDLSDGSIISFDKVRRQFLLTTRGGGVVSVGGSLPARPNPPGHGGSAIVEALTTPVVKAANCRKLGYKKAPIIKSQIWNDRHVRLEPKQVHYCVNANSPAKGVIELGPGCTTRVIQAHESARKDRFEDNDYQGALAAMSTSIAQQTSNLGSNIGAPNCVELHVPANVGNVLGSMMSASPLDLAFGSASKQITKNVNRTYYFSFPTLSEANEFSAAIDNNIRAILQEQPALGSQPIGGIDRNNMGAPGAFNNLTAMMNMAHTYQANQGDMKDPNKSLEWFRSSLGTQVSTEHLYERVSYFYDQLAAAGLGR